MRGVDLLSDSISFVCGLAVGSYTSSVVVATQMRHDVGDCEKTEKWIRVSDGNTFGWRMDADSEADR